MTHLHLKFVQEFRDRHGQVRRYFRRPGSKRVPLPGLPGSEEFMLAYQAALADAPLSVGVSKSAPGTVAATVAAYFESAAHKSLAATTRQTYRGILENFRDKHGSQPIALLEPRHIDRIIAAKAATPSAANNLLRMLHVLMQFAVTEGLRRDDPTQGVKPIKNRSTGFHSWTEDEITQFEAKHPIGTQARLALGLHLYTAQRRGDVVKMGRQHIRDGVLTLRQSKTGVEVEIPISPELAEIIDAVPKDRLTFLVTERGKPFTAQGYGDRFREWCREAGLPEVCGSHGLRKAASRWLAERGCNVHEIMSITGHKTLKDIARYTAAFDRRQAAVSAMRKMNAAGTATVKPLKKV